MKNLIKPVLLASLVATAFSAQAADDVAVAAAAPVSPHTITTNIGLFTDYTFRGISYSKENGAVQGGFDYAHSSGLYAGVWATNVDKNALYTNTVELDVYGGYASSFGDTGIGYNIGFLQFFYPDAERAGSTPGVKGVGGSPNTTELNAALSYKYFTLKHSVAVTNFFGVNNSLGGNGNSRGTGYTELNVAYKLPVADLNLALHVGYQNVHNYSVADYTDWLVGVNKDFSIAGSTGWNAGLSYTTTNADDAWYVDAKGWETGDDRVIGYIKRTF